MQALSPNADRPLNTVEASRYLLAMHGISYAPATLTQMRYRPGDGPKWRKSGPRFVVYSMSDLDAWASARLSPPLHSTQAREAA